MSDHAAPATLFSELTDSCLYRVQCPREHVGYVVLQQQKFELLFDVGACALLDGYYREAVSSFTSSLERFREFFVRAAFLQNGMPQKEIEAIWSPLAKQSERQLGAYVAVYARECGNAPPLLANKYVSFRNDVIHRGTIPNRAEAVAYGEAVLAEVRPALAIAKKQFADGVNGVVAQHMVAAHRTLSPGTKVATSCLPTILSLSQGEELPFSSLEETLANFQSWPGIRRS